MHLGITLLVISISGVVGMIADENKWLKHPSSFWLLGLISGLIVGAF